jgi:hypothetical protein
MFDNYLDLINNLLKNKEKNTSEEVELMSENVKYKEKAFQNKGGILFQGLKVEQLQSNNSLNNI